MLPGRKIPTTKQTCIRPGDLIGFSYLLLAHSLLSFCAAAFPKFQPQMSLDNDYKVVKTSTGILYLLERYVQMITDSRTFFNKAVAVYL